MNYLPFIFASIVIVSVAFVDLYIVDQLSFEEDEFHSETYILNKLKNNTIVEFISYSMNESDKFITIPINYNISFHSPHSTTIREEGLVYDNEDEELEKRLSNVYNTYPY